MATFRTPTLQWAWPTGHRLFDRIRSINRPLAVVKVNGHYVTQESPWLGDIQDLTEGVDYFMGGREYTIACPAIVSLVADGLGGGITFDDTYIDTYSGCYG